MIDKILVFGDSIAYDKWDKSGGWVARLRSYIDQKYNIGLNGNVRVFNLGVPSDLAITLVERLEAELKARVGEERNGLVIFAVGINDSCTNNWRIGKQTLPVDFKNALRKMIKTSSSYGCVSVFIGLTPVNPKRAKKLNFSSEEIKEYDSYITEVCREKGIKKLELLQDLIDMNFANLLVDAVHPNTKGHQVLFAKIKVFLEREADLN
jgi:lysophospholipase L1-like esterase